MACIVDRSPAFSLQELYRHCMEPLILNKATQGTSQSQSCVRTNSFTLRYSSDSAADEGKRQEILQSAGYTDSQSVERWMTDFDPLCALIFKTPGQNWRQCSLAS
ncbi:hypothetical protein BaRGS_00005684 [Batillaria attramentaria]|uniref:Uncharacterized protein n=1 Tax=Batillaria attramentaria TaxID=370345 RepID=A0ABD0LV98_9CAEN